MKGKKGIMVAVFALGILGALSCLKKKLRPICVPQDCEYDCPYGFVEDENGCKTCKCKPKPGCVCSSLWDPVCGQDGATYGNECEAECAGVDIAYKGECKKDECKTHQDCDDNDPCTIDRCERPRCEDGTRCPGAAGKCVYTPNPECECQTDKDCDDEDPCTIDRCERPKCKPGTKCPDAIPKCVHIPDETCNPCGNGLTYCNGECVDLNNDPRHCSDCGLKCAIGETCKEGKCKPVPPGCKTMQDCSRSEFCVEGECKRIECYSIKDCPQVDCPPGTDCLSFICKHGVCIKERCDKDDEHYGCYTLYAPVCGPDSKTYSNDCVAECYGKVDRKVDIDIKYNGECRDDCASSECNCVQLGCPKNWECVYFGKDNEDSFCRRKK